MTAQEKATAAEECRQYYTTHGRRANVRNVCTARSCWNGCPYADIYGAGGDCWKQDGPHKCVRLLEAPRE